MSEPEDSPPTKRRAVGGQEDEVAAVGAILAAVVPRPYAPWDWDEMVPHQAPTFPYGKEMAAWPSPITPGTPGPAAPVPKTSVPPGTPGPAVPVPGTSVPPGPAVPVPKTSAPWTPKTSRASAQSRANAQQDLDDTYGEPVNDMYKELALDEASQPMIDARPL